MSELTDRRARLQNDITELDRKAREAEDGAAIAMAEGKSTDAAMASVAKLQDQARIARAALVALDRAIQSEVREAKAARTQNAQSEADRLDLEAREMHITLREQLAGAVATLTALSEVQQRLGALVLDGARARYVMPGVRAAALKASLDQLEQRLAATLDADALAPLGLKKPPTPREQTIVGLEAALDANAANIAELEKRAAAAQAPGNFEAALRDLKSAGDRLREQLAHVRGDKAPKMNAKERLRQLAGLQS
jgi:hypothetical protein